MSEFIEYLRELFQEFGEVENRRMFGGHGIFRDGIMFGLVSDEMLYLKTNGDTAERFKARGLKPFTYRKKDRTVSLAYYPAPEEALEDPTELCRWASQAYEVAVRSQKRS